MFKRHQDLIHYINKNCYNIDILEREKRFINEPKPVQNELSNEDKSQSDVKYDPQKGWNFEEHKKKSDELKDDISDRFEFEYLPF